MIAGMIAPFILAFVYTIPLWVLRNYWPKGEDYFYGPLYHVGKFIGYQLRRLLQAVRHLAA